MTSPDFLQRKQQEIAQRSDSSGHEVRWCRHDQQMVRALGPSPAWHWIAPVLGVVGFLVVLGTLFIDPVGIAALIVALLYIAALGPVIALARSVPKCPICRREVPYHSREEAEADLRRAPTHAPV